MKKVMQRREVNHSTSAKLHFWECLLCPPRTEVFHFLDICLAHLETNHGITFFQVNLKDGSISAALPPLTVKGERSDVRGNESRVDIMRV